MGEEHNKLADNILVTKVLPTNECLVLGYKMKWMYKRVPLQDAFKW